MRNVKLGLIAGILGSFLYSCIPQNPENNGATETPTISSTPTMQTTPTATYTLTPANTLTVTPTPTQESCQNIPCYNERLFYFNEEYNSGNASALEQMVTISEERENLMRDLIIDNTRLYLSEAMTTENRDKFPEDVKANIEEQVGYCGIFEIRIEDDNEEYWLNTMNRGSYRLFFDFELPDSRYQLVNQTISVQGFQLDEKIGVENLYPEIECVN